MSSRAFPASTDFVDTGVSAGKGSTNAFTCGAWVKQTTVNANQRAIMAGEESGSGNGWNFYLAAADATTFKIRFRPGNGHGDSTSAAITHDIQLPIFVACVNSVADNNIRFYAGTTPETIVLITTIGTTRSLHASIGAATIHVGCKKNSSGSRDESHIGWISQPFLAFDQEFTLAQIKFMAACGGNAGLHALCTFAYLFDGSDPEQDQSPNNLDGDVTGTSVEADMCVNFAQPANASQIMQLM